MQYTRKVLPRADRKHHIIFYGVSGYTGNLIMEYLKRQVRETDVRIAFAGRTGSKVEALRDKVLGGTRWQDCPIIEASLDNPFDVEKLVHECSVIVNVAGPFMHTGGEALVEACIEYDTDYTDVNGEIPYGARLLEVRLALPCAVALL